MNTALEIALPAGLAAREPTMLDVKLTLAIATTRIAIRAAQGTLGRAEALFGERSWSAKHYWPEGPDVTVFEFDEPLPAGSVSLRILHTPTPE